MIKIERKLTGKAQKAIASLEKAETGNSSYNTTEVNLALKEMFHNKCYICENKQVTSYNIEHLHPYYKNKNLKYDWNNLFLSCAHCNNTKLGIRKETINTINLLNEVYYGSTPQKKMEARILRRILRKVLSEFKEFVREYKEAEDDEIV